MKKSVLFLLLLSSLVISAQKKYVLVIHGGAGTITKENMTAEKEKAYREKLTEALKAGFAEIQKGKSSVDAVAASIVTRSLSGGHRSSWMTGRRPARRSTDLPHATWAPGLKAAYSGLTRQLDKSFAPKR